MKRPAGRRKTKRPTLWQIREEVRRLRKRVENPEDVRDLTTAIDRNAGKPGIPWAQAKKEFGL